MIHYSQKIIATLLVVITVASSVAFLAYPQHSAEAQAGAAGCLLANAAATVGAGAGAAAVAAGLAVPTFDGANLVVNTSTAGSTAALESKDCLLDAIAWALAKAAVSSISTSIINWINSGFNGSPAFVTDLRGFLGFVELEEFERFIGSDTIALLCSPWRFNIRLALELELLGRDKLSCTIGDVVDNIDDFLEGDFSQGGWDGWLHLSTRNNPHKDFLAAEATARGQIAFVKAEQVKLLDFGRGFHSFETCTSRPANPGDPNSQPGDTVEDCTIGTPGAVIETQLEHTLGTNLRQLELSDEIDEILSALIAQLINQVITTGLRNL